MKYKELLRDLLGCEADYDAEVIFTDTETGQRFKVTSVGYIENEQKVNLNNCYDF